MTAAATRRAKDMRGSEAAAALRSTTAADEAADERTPLLVAQTSSSTAEASTSTDTDAHVGATVTAQHAQAQVTTRLHSAAAIASSSADEGDPWTAQAARAIAALRNGALPSSTQLAFALRRGRDALLPAGEQDELDEQAGRDLFQQALARRRQRQRATGESKEMKRMRTAARAALGDLAELIEHKNKDDIWQEALHEYRRYRRRRAREEKRRHEEEQRDLEHSDAPDPPTPTLVEVAAEGPSTLSLAHKHTKRALTCIIELIVARAARGAAFGTDKEPLARDLHALMLEIKALADQFTGRGNRARKKELEGITKLDTSTDTSVDEQVVTRALAVLTDLRDAIYDASAHDEAFRANVSALIALARAPLAPAQDPLHVPRFSLSCTTRTLIRRALSPFIGDLRARALLVAIGDVFAKAQDDAQRLADLAAALDSALANVQADPVFAPMRQDDIGRVALALNELLKANPALRDAVADAAERLSDAVMAVSSDRYVLSALSSTLELASVTSAWAAQGTARIWRDMLDNVLPALLSTVKQLPLPRLEFASNAVQAAVDAPNLVSVSLLPDSVRVRTTNELELKRGEPLSVHTAQMHVALDGLRLNVHNIGYFARYRGACCLSFTDDGLLDLDVGELQGERGLRAEASLSREKDGERWRVDNVTVDVRPVRVWPHDSTRHWLLAWLVRPLVSSAARVALRMALEGQVRAALEKAADLAQHVEEVRNERDSHTVAGWFEALYEAVTSSNDDGEDDEQPDESSDGDSEDEEGGHVRVTARGVAYETEEQTVGIGGEGVVLPEGEAETPVPRPSILKNEREAVEDVQAAQAAYVDERQRQVTGWRSDAFTIT